MSHLRFFGVYNPSGSIAEAFSAGGESRDGIDPISRDGNINELPSSITLHVTRMDHERHVWPIQAKLRLPLHQTYPNPSNV